MSPALSIVAVASTLAALGTGLSGVVWRGAVKNSEPRCSVLAVSDVQVVPHGFVIAPLDEFVPQEQALQSSLGGYWLCVIDDESVTLLVPPEQF